jgi:predicted negative regulator of RcsB-dependent stress response
MAKGVIIGVIVVLLVSAGAVGWYMYQSKQTAEAQATAQAASNQQVTAMTAQLATLVSQLNSATQ